MSRETFIFRNGDVLPKGLFRHEHFLEARSDLPAPMIIRDGMDALVNPVNGMHYESKSSFEKAVKAAGCVVMGNDAPTTQQNVSGDRISKNEIGDAIQKVRQGYRPELPNEPEYLDFTE